MSNKLSRLWQELKRRNVIRVVTVYAGAAFVILELVDMIREPFELPNWSFKLVVAILAAGLVVAIILSWIYDMHPTAGMVKTAPVGEAEGAGGAEGEDDTDGTGDEVPRSLLGWKIASYISFVIIVGLILLNLIPRSGKGESIDKSIAVLPFLNDSPGEEKMYFINGTMEAILNNLSMIQDLKVVSRNSVEQYRNNPRPTPVVAQEMDVSYVLEGSGHRDGDSIRIYVQLLDGREDRHLWSRSYNAYIGEIFTVQSEIAQLVAREIEAIITPEEKERIDRVPTSSLIAYEFYQKGLEEHWKYRMNFSNRQALRDAERQYTYALEYDPDFALAYIGLADAYWSRNYWNEYYTETFMDSAMILVDRAHALDPELSDVYLLRGRYNYETGRPGAAIEAYERGLGLNPNNSRIYTELSGIYMDRDLVKSIENAREALALNRETDRRPYLIRTLAAMYEDAGIYDRSLELTLEALHLDGDSVAYFNALMLSEFFRGNFGKSMEYGLRSYGLQTANYMALQYLAESYGYLGQWEESLFYFRKFLERLAEIGFLRNNSMHRVAYAYHKNGMEREADSLFSLQMEYSLQDIHLGRPEATGGYSYANLACVQAYRGEIEEAMGNLRIFMRRDVMPSWAAQIKWDPLLENLRGEPEFQQIVREVEARYQAEHERVLQWLEESDLR